MKITKQQLKKLIQEELNHILNERGEHQAPDPITSTSGGVRSWRDSTNQGFSPSGETWTGDEDAFAHTTQTRGGVTGPYEIRNLVRVVRGELKKADAALDAMERKGAGPGKTRGEYPYEDIKVLAAALRKAAAML